MALLPSHPQQDPLSESHTGLSESKRRAPHAPPVARDDWHSPTTPLLAPLNAEQRRKLAEVWLAEALEHHAAVGRYARLSLQMLALGAPPDLLMAAQHAAGDKVRHAQSCLGLASAYAGRPLGPGPLPAPAAEDTPQLQHAVIAAIADGCVAETLRAMNAESALARCQDPAVRSVLATLAREQRRHAGLAWRFVRWAFSQDDGAMAPEAARNAFQLAANQHRIEAQRHEPDWLIDHGCLREQDREQIAEATLNEVVLPCAEALLADIESQRRDSATIVA